MTRPVWDVVVVGGGAAGLFCAAIAGQRGLRVLVIDHAKTLGEKIRISGGGRCNFTNRQSGPAHFLSLNPPFVRSALARYRPTDFVDLIRRHRIGYHEKHKGQLFCNDSAQQIVAMLLAECATGGVTLRHPVSVVSQPRQDSLGWGIETTMGPLLAHQLVVATGGLPVPAIGASAWALDFARALDLAVTAVRPALVPLAFTDETSRSLIALAGLSLPVRIHAGGSPSAGHPYGEASFEEDLLITHKGLSGPAVLQASSYWQEGEPLAINWLAAGEDNLLTDESLAAGRSVEGLLGQCLPQRLADAFADQLGLRGRRWVELSKADRRRAQALVSGWQAIPAGTLGWKKAEVMLGGVDTRELDSKTMMAKRYQGLYFIGECMDVTGHLGGHNFQWAWASAYACAQALVSSSNP